MANQTKTTEYPCGNSLCCAEHQACDICEVGKEFERRQAQLKEAQDEIKARIEISKDQAKLNNDLCKINNDLKAKVAGALETLNRHLQSWEEAYKDEADKDARFLQKTAIQELKRLRLQLTKEGES